MKWVWRMVFGSLTVLLFLVVIVQLMLMSGGRIGSD